MEIVHTLKMFQAWDCLSCRHLKKKELMTETQDMGLSLQQFSVARIIKDPETEIGAQPQN